MANVSEKKKKLFYLLEILHEKTDADHALTLPEILQELESRGISAERKSIYDDLETLKSLGFQIETLKNKNFKYYIEKRKIPFEDISLLCSAAQHADFISEQKLAELTDELSLLCSRWQAEKLTEPQCSRGEPVKVEFSEEICDAVIKRFGKYIEISACGDSLSAVVQTEVNDELFSWLFALGSDIKLVSPEKAVKAFRCRLNDVSKLYN